MSTMLMFFLFFTTFAAAMEKEIFSPDSIESFPSYKIIKYCSKQEHLPFLSQILEGILIQDELMEKTAEWNFAQKKLDSFEQGMSSDFVNNESVAVKILQNISSFSPVTVAAVLAYPDLFKFSTSCDIENEEAKHLSNQIKRKNEFIESFERFHNDEGLQMLIEFFKNSISINDVKKIIKPIELQIISSCLNDTRISNLVKTDRVLFKHISNIQVIFLKNINELVKTESISDESFKNTKTEIEKHLNGYKESLQSIRVYYESIYDKFKEIDPNATRTAKYINLNQNGLALKKPYDFLQSKSLQEEKEEKEEEDNSKFNFLDIHNLPTGKTTNTKSRKNKKSQRRKAYLTKESKVEIIADKRENITDTPKDSRYIKSIQENGQTFEIFKTDITNNWKQTPTIIFTDGVSAWQKNPQEALINQGYCDQNNKKFSDPAEYPNIIAVHNFSKKIDLLIFKWGKVSLISSRENLSDKCLQIVLPGTIQLKKGIELGIYRYLFNLKKQTELSLPLIQENPKVYIGKCFHRTFDPIEGKKIVQQCLTGEWFEKGFFEVHFPPLK